VRFMERSLRLSGWGGFGDAQTLAGDEIHRRQKIVRDLWAMLI
jgi:hypothetical protein